MSDNAKELPKIRVWKKDEMSKEDAKKMLEALQQKEKELQEKLQKKKMLLLKVLK